MYLLVAKGDDNLMIVTADDLERELKNVVKEHELVIKIMQETTQYLESNLQQKYILKQAFLDVISAWCAFSATDINGDGLISLKELEFLLYAYEGEKVDQYRVNQDMEELDKDKSGEVSREEWILYLCTKCKGKYYLRSTIRKQFNLFDVNNSGSLDRGELKNLLVDTFKEYLDRYNGLDQENKAGWKGMLYELTDKIMAGMNENSGEDKEISWAEFKRNFEKMQVEIQQFSQFMKLI